MSESPPSEELEGSEDTVATAPGAEVGDSEPEDLPIDAPESEERAEDEADEAELERSESDEPTVDRAQTAEAELADSHADEPGEDESDEDTQELEIPEPPLSRPSDGTVALLPKSVWPIWAWIMVGVAVAVLAVGVLGGVLLASVVLDVLSFWPGFLFTFLLAAALWPMSRRFSSRLKATVPLLVLTWLGLAVALHLSAWSELPSSAGDLLGGPVAEVGAASVSLENDGLVVLTSAPQAEAYEVTMIRRGGPVGAPQALETMPDRSLVVDIVERAPSDWYSAAGWQVVLATQVAWTVDVAAAEFDLDLRLLTVRAAAVSGSGVVSLGAVEPNGTVTLDGMVTVTVPAGAAVVVSGSAAVPGAWVATDSGFESPGSGTAYTLSVTEGATVTIAER